MYKFGKKNMKKDRFKLYIKKLVNVYLLHHLERNKMYFQPDGTPETNQPGLKAT